MERGYQPSFEFEEEERANLDKPAETSGKLSGNSPHRPIYSRLSEIRRIKQESVDTWRPSGDIYLSPESITKLLEITNTIGRDYDYSVSTELGPRDYRDGQKIYSRGGKIPYGLELAQQNLPKTTDYAGELSRYIRRTGNISKVTDRNRGIKVTEHYSRKKIFAELIDTDTRSLRAEMKTLEKFRQILGTLFESERDFHDFSWEIAKNLGEDSLVKSLKPAQKVFNKEIGNFDTKRAVDRTIRRMYQQEDQASLSVIIRASAIFYEHLYKQTGYLLSHTQLEHGRFGRYEEEAKKQAFKSKKPHQSEVIFPFGQMYRPEQDEQDQLDID